MVGETFDILGLDGGRSKQVRVQASSAAGTGKTFKARVRIDTPKEREYYRNGGILHTVLRKMARGEM